MRGFAVAAFCSALVVGAVGAVTAVIVAISDQSSSIFELGPGECFDLPVLDDGSPTAALDQVDDVDCDDPHTAEVVAIGQLDREQARERPTDDELFDEVWAACRALEPEAEELGFGLVPVIPNEDTWVPRGGQYACLAVPYGGTARSGSITANITGPG